MTQIVCHIVVQLQYEEVLQGFQLRVTTVGARCCQHCSRFVQSELFFPPCRFIGTCYHGMGCHRLRLAETAFGHWGVAGDILIRSYGRLTRGGAQLLGTSTRNQKITVLKEIS